MEKLHLTTAFLIVSVVAFGRPQENVSTSPQPNPIGLTSSSSVTSVDLAKLSRFNVASLPSEEEANYVSDMGYLFNRFIKVSPCNPENFIFRLPQLLREINKRKAKGRKGIETMLEMFKAVEDMDEIDQALTVGGYLDEMLTQAEIKYKNSSDSSLKSLYREMRLHHLSLELNLVEMEEWKYRSPREPVWPKYHSHGSCPSCGMGDETEESNEDDSEEDGIDSGDALLSLSDARSQVMGRDNK